MKHIGLYIDLGVANTIQEAIQATDQGWEELVTMLRNYLSNIDSPDKAEVVIKEKDGSFTTKTFEQFRDELKRTTS